LTGNVKLDPRIGRLTVSPNSFNKIVQSFSPLHLAKDRPDGAAYCASA
jgi:hypothetical protein